MSVAALRPPEGAAEDTTPGDDPTAGTAALVLQVGLLRAALLEAARVMREAESLMDYATLGRCKWLLIRAADLAATVARRG